MMGSGFRRSDVNLVCDESEAETAADGVCIVPLNCPPPPLFIMSADREALSPKDDDNISLVLPLPPLLLPKQVSHLCKGFYRLSKKPASSVCVTRPP